MTKSPKTSPKAPKSHAAETIAQGGDEAETNEQAAVAGRGKRDRPGVNVPAEGADTDGANKAPDSKQKAPEPKAKPSKGRQMLEGMLNPLLNGKAALTVNSRTLDGRYRGWICKPDGTRIERVMVNSMEEAEDRAKVLEGKGALKP